MCCKFDREGIVGSGSQALSENWSQTKRYFSALSLCVTLFCGLLSTECLQESQKIPELLTLRLVHLQGAVISGGKVSTSALLFLTYCSMTICGEVILTVSFFLFSEERPSLYHPWLSWGPLLGPASLVLQGVHRAQGCSTPTADLAVLDRGDTPPAFQQSRRAAGGDQDDIGELLPAPELEPPSQQRLSRQAELGGQPDLPPEPNAKYEHVRTIVWNQYGGKTSDFLVALTKWVMLFAANFSCCSWDPAVLWQTSPAGCVPQQQLLWTHPETHSEQQGQTSVLLNMCPSIGPSVFLWLLMWPLFTF